jgi:hypothetical protein
MKIKSTQTFYTLCLLIIGTSALNLSMNFYYLKHLSTNKLKQFNQLQTVDQILKTPQTIQKKKESQMARVINETRVNIAIMNNKAYWIRNNTVFSSKLDEDGNVDIANAEKVDVFSLSEKDMKTIIGIIDSLNK